MYSQRLCNTLPCGTSHYNTHSIINSKRTSNRKQASVLALTLPKEVRDNDVLGGRGGITNFHQGNLLLHKIVREILRLFDLQNKEHPSTTKRVLATAIVDGMFKLFGTTFWEKLTKTRNGMSHLTPVAMGREGKVKKVMQRFREVKQKAGGQDHDHDDIIDRNVQELFEELFDRRFPDVGHQIRNRKSDNERIFFIPTSMKTSHDRAKKTKPTKRSSCMIKTKGAGSPAKHRRRHNRRKTRPSKETSLMVESKAALAISAVQTKPCEAVSVVPTLSSLLSELQHQGGGPHKARITYVLPEVEVDYDPISQEAKDDFLPDGLTWNEDPSKGLLSSVEGAQDPLPLEPSQMDDAGSEGTMSVRSLSDADDDMQQFNDLALDLDPDILSMLQDEEFAKETDLFFEQLFDCSNQGTNQST